MSNPKLTDDAVFMRYWGGGISLYKTLVNARRAQSYGDAPEAIRLYAEEMLPVVPDFRHETLKRHQRITIEDALDRGEIARLAVFWMNLALQRCGERSIVDMLADRCGFEFAEAMTLAWGAAATRIERANRDTTEAQR